MTNAQQVSATELHDLLKSSAEVILLDVRQPDERQYAFIDSAQAAQAASSITEFKTFEKPPTQIVNNLK